MPPLDTDPKDLPDVPDRTPSSPGYADGDNLQLRRLVALQSMAREIAKNTAETSELRKGVSADVASLRASVVDLEHRVGPVIDAYLEYLEVLAAERLAVAEENARIGARRKNAGARFQAGFVELVLSKPALVFYGAVSTAIAGWFQLHAGAPAVTLPPVP